MRVLIAGGGLGGLLLAHRLLQEKNEQGIEVIVLERDENASSRDQGIVIGLSQDGVDAVNSVGLGHILQKLMNSKQVGGGARHVALRSPSGTVLIKGNRWMEVKLSDGKTASALLSRSLLRQELAAALPAGIIHWDSRVVNVREDDTSVYVELSNGQTIQGDVLVGADGARSFIRETFFPELVPAQLGLYTTWGTLKASAFPDNALLKESLQSLVRTNGRMGCSMLSFAFTTANDTDTVLFWSISMPQIVAQPIIGIPDLTEADVRARLLEICRNSFDESSEIELLVKLSEKVVQMYEMTSVHPSIYKRNRVLGKNKKSRVTLLGDAAHKTTTQAGLGATAAFQDALALGKVLVDAKKGSFNPEIHLREMYEPNMIITARKVVGASLGNTEMIHQIRGPVGMALTNVFMRTVGGIISLVQTVKSAYA
jgi:2-polyprenyl-6-methoxyphenol hydroxylase-like FAD-dependent oxidoreductase